ncbi:translation initiation factor IF-2-like [Panthera pardus]|uniref:Translation initiation factor IF-2-like n=1 Tax=Panthera pardus TaxID=9691 RepID=A0A9W2VVX8_PANPR|nr:translation initiation factor IF-2-like [Panthera pardus]
MKCKSDPGLHSHRLTCALNLKAPRHRTSCDLDLQEHAYADQTVPDYEGRFQSRNLSPDGPAPACSRALGERPPSEALGGRAASCSPAALSQPRIPAPEPRRRQPAGGVGAAAAAAAARGTHRALTVRRSGGWEAPEAASPRNSVPASVTWSATPRALSSGARRGRRGARGGRLGHARARLPPLAAPARPPRAGTKRARRPRAVSGLRGRAGAAAAPSTRGAGLSAARSAERLTGPRGPRPARSAPASCPPPPPPPPPPPRHLPPAPRPSLSAPPRGARCGAGAGEGLRPPPLRADSRPRRPRRGAPGAPCQLGRRRGCEDERECAYVWAQPSPVEEQRS